MEGAKSWTLASIGAISSWSLAQSSIGAALHRYILLWTGLSIDPLLILLPAITGASLLLAQEEGTIKTAALLGFLYFLPTIGGVKIWDVPAYTVTSSLLFLAFTLCVYMEGMSREAKRLEKAGFGLDELSEVVLQNLKASSPFVVLGFLMALALQLRSGFGTSSYGPLPLLFLPLLAILLGAFMAFHGRRSEGEAKKVRKVAKVYMVAGDTFTVSKKEVTMDSTFLLLEGGSPVARTVFLELEEGAPDSITLRSPWDLKTLWKVYEYEDGDTKYVLLSQR
ncbi:hypothetical protein [Thermococcus sp.]